MVPNLAPGVRESVPHGGARSLTFGSKFFGWLTLRMPGSWEKSFALANAAVEQMTLDEKIGVVSGVGTFVSRCVGSNGAVPRLGIPSICMQDGPAG